MPNTLPLSGPALIVLRAHLGRYLPGIGGGTGLELVPGHSDDQVRAVYRELERAGLMREYDPLDRLASEPACYGLTREAKRLHARFAGDRPA